MEKDFTIRTYGFAELALLYFPNSTKKSASTQLGRWVRQNEHLKKNLRDSGFKPGRRVLTPKQVEILVDIIGEPNY